MAQRTAQNSTSHCSSLYWL